MPCSGSTPPPSSRRTRRSARDGLAVRHMRWPVEVVLDSVSSGMSTDEILSDPPRLEHEDIVSLFRTTVFSRPASLSDVLLDAGSLRCSYFLSTRPRVIASRDNPFSTTSLSIINAT
ncbi:DUF433 domain-containing protein [Halochromatium sp.]